MVLTTQFRRLTLKPKGIKKKKIKTKNLSTKI